MACGTENQGQVGFPVGFVWWHRAAPKTPAPPSPSSSLPGWPACFCTEGGERQRQRECRCPKSQGSPRGHSDWARGPLRPEPIRQAGWARPPIPRASARVGFPTGAEPRRGRPPGSRAGRVLGGADPAPCSPATPRSGPVSWSPSQWVSAIRPGPGPGPGARESAQVTAPPSWPHRIGRRDTCAGGSHALDTSSLHPFSRAPTTPHPGGLLRWALAPDLTRLQPPHRSGRVL